MNGRSWGQNNIDFKTLNKSLDNNYRSEEFLFHNEMDYEVQNEKYVIQKSKVGI
jgi:hypothetical protein